MPSYSSLLLLQHISVRILPVHLLCMLSLHQRHHPHMLSNSLEKLYHQNLPMPVASHFRFQNILHDKALYVRYPHELVPNQFRHLDSFQLLHSEIPPNLLRLVHFHVQGYTHTRFLNLPDLQNLQFL